MAYSSLCALSFLLSLLLPAMKAMQLDSTSYVYSQSFITIILIITSYINGFGEGISQSAAGTYMSDCATEYTKGFYYAMYWASYMGSQVAGNLIAAFVLNDLDQRSFVLIILACSVVASVLFFLLKKPLVMHEYLRRMGLDDETKAARRRDK